MKRILFVHQNYPGQFKHLGPMLSHQGLDVVALRQCWSLDSNASTILDGVRVRGWQAGRGTTLTAHPWVQDMETKLIRAEASAVSCDKLKQEGWNPDLIIGHPGWGEMLFIQNIWPGVPQIHFLEFYYTAKGLDVGFDPEFPTAGWREEARISAKTGPALMSLEQMTLGLSPTHFQASTYPSWRQDQIRVIHDGVDTTRIRPNNETRLLLNNQQVELRPGDPVITFINRNLEPYRGYHRFMRALPEIQRECPEAITLIVGGDGVSYGAAPPTGTSWKQIFLDEVLNELDMSRIHFTGNIDYDTYLSVLQVSACHVYFTYPFVLGWSCIEAMAAGALVIGSCTEPVKEVIRDGQNGLLVDFFDHDELVRSVCAVLRNPSNYEDIRKKARDTTVDHYDLNSVCLPKQMMLVNELLHT